MKSWLLALAGLLGLTAAQARADYLMLIVNVGQQAVLVANPGPGPGTGPGPGPSIRPPMGGVQGMMGGNVGFRGTPMPMGGQPPGSMGGMVSSTMQGSTAHIASQLIPVWVEVEFFPSPLVESQFNGGLSTPIRHKWGTVNLWANKGRPDSGPIALAAFYHGRTDGRPFPKVIKRFELEHARALKEKTLESQLALAEWALSHGLLTKFEDTMDKLALDEKSNPAIVAYQKIKADLKIPVSRLPAAPWYAKLKPPVYKEDLQASAHYVLLHNLPEKDPDLLSRAGKLEDNLRSFYYWFALRGLVLPLPQERLVAVLSGGEDEFKHRLHKDLFGGPIVSDGFHTPRENIVVLSARPRSADYDALDKFGKQFWDQASMAKAVMLKGKLKPSKVEEAHAGALALVSKSLEESSELASISHNGSRQLLSATGLLPRHVVMPEWVSYGLSSVFETPMGSPWRTLGAPSSAYWPYLKEHMPRGNLETTGAAVIRQIVTDSYFRQAHLAPKDKAALTRAQATAWGLAYHLARKELPKLQAYFKELARMPRDLDLDEEVLLGCFARAFDAWDSNKKTILTPRLENLYSQWERDINASSLESQELNVWLSRALQEAEKAVNPPPPNPAGTPGQPGR